MKHFFFFGFCCVMTMINSVDAHGKSDNHGVFSILNIGDSLSLKEVGQKYDLTKMGDMPSTYTVVNVGSDFVDLKLGPMIMRIPVTSVRAISVINTSATK